MLSAILQATALNKYHDLLAIKVYVDNSQLVYIIVLPDVCKTDGFTTPFVF